MASGAQAAVVSGPMGTGLKFSKMTDLGTKAGFDLQFNLADKAATAYLCVGREDNRVLVSGTTPLSRRDKVLAAIDEFGKWGESISLWMVSEKAGAVAARTAAIAYTTHVKPYEGALTISEIGSDGMTYPGNGKGRLLSEKINDRYYFVYGGKLETSNDMRGFDCTSFPMALFSLTRLLSPGYGKQLCDALKAEKCDLEQLKGADLAKRFKEDTVPVGIYILFSAGHVLLYNSNINQLYEFNYGGFKETPAYQRALVAPQDLWWMRKLPETYRSFFS